MEPEGGQRAPERLGPKAPVTKLSRRCHFSVAIFVVAQLKIVLALIIDKAGVVVANCSG